MARRTRRERGLRFTWTRQRVQVLVLIGFVVWVIAALSVSVAAYGSLLGTQRLETSGTYSLEITGLPGVTYSANISYASDGEFSVGSANPIHMRALVYNTNLPNFTSYFYGIGLLYEDVPVALGSSGSISLLPHFRAAGPGEWELDAEVVFARPINFTGPVLALASSPSNVPGAEISSEVSSQVKAYDYPFPTLQPQSYTAHLSTEESELRYGAAASALLLVLLLPLFYRVLLPREREDLGKE